MYILGIGTANPPARFTKAMLRHGLDYVQQRYGQRHAAEDVPPREPSCSATTVSKHVVWQSSHWTMSSRSIPTRCPSVS